MCVSSSHSLFMLERVSPNRVPASITIHVIWLLECEWTDRTCCAPPPPLLFTVFNGGQSECPLYPSSLHFILSAEATITTITFSSNFLFHCHLNYEFKSRTVTYETMGLDAIVGIQWHCPLSTVHVSDNISIFCFTSESRCFAIYVIVVLLPI